MDLCRRKNTKNSSTTRIKRAWCEDERIGYSLSGVIKEEYPSIEKQSKEENADNTN